jgi:hypothetical protein
MAIIIGPIIHDLVKDSGLKAKVVADYVNVSTSTLFGIYKRESVDIDKLILFSKLLNKNLFIYYLDEEPLKSIFGKDVTELKSHILELENELKSKNNKLEDLTEIIDAQKKVISLHEANVSKASKKSK